VDFGDTAMLRRFLMARKLQVEPAVEMLIKHLEWRKANLPVRMTPAIEAELKKGKTFVRGCDLQGRPLMVIKSACFDPKTRDLEATVCGSENISPRPVPPEHCPPPAHAARLLPRPSHRRVHPAFGHILLLPASLLPRCRCLPAISLFFLPLHLHSTPTYTVSPTVPFPTWSQPHSRHNCSQLLPTSYLPRCWPSCTNWKRRSATCQRDSRNSASSMTARCDHEPHTTCHPPSTTHPSHRFACQHQHISAPPPSHFFRPVFTPALTAAPHPKERKPSKFILETRPRTHNHPNAAASSYRCPRAAV
jgi:hypothetical protein